MPAERVCRISDGEVAFSVKGDFMYVWSNLYQRMWERLCVRVFVRVCFRFSYARLCIRLKLYVFVYLLKCVRLCFCVITYLNHTRGCSCTYYGVRSWFFVYLSVFLWEGEYFVTCSGALGYMHRRCVPLRYQNSSNDKMQGQQCRYQHTVNNILPLRIVIAFRNERR